MSTTPTNDGGPAFPGNLTNYKCKQKLAEDLYQFDGAAPGMSLRDYFAAKAMAALLTAEWNITRGLDADFVAEEACQYADALISKLAARNQTTK